LQASGNLKTEGKQQRKKYYLHTMHVLSWKECEWLRLPYSQKMPWVEKRTWRTHSHQQ